MFVAESALDTLKSLRHPTQGCPFIKVFCEELLEKWKDYSLEKICTQFIALNLKNYNIKGKIWNLNPKFSILGNNTEEMNLNLFALLTNEESSAFSCQGIKFYLHYTSLKNNTICTMVSIRA